MTLFKLLSTHLLYRKVPTSPSFPAKIKEFISLPFRHDYKRVPNQKKSVPISDRGVFTGTKGVFTNGKGVFIPGKGVFTFTLILSIWLVMNLLQSTFTQIANDEAYYWLFSKHLDWGYFDHPPMIVLWIHAGNLFFTSELGVRFIVILMQLVSLFLIWKTIDDKNAKSRNIIFFFGLAAAIPLFQIYGFIATPDATLLFFTALFLFAYKHFLANKSWSYTILLGFTMACLMYSKYHGALVILFTIASNFRLLGNRHFIIAGSIALLLFLPHLNWQIEHDFPTLQFQMTERFKSFRFTHFFEYWPYQMIALNPFVIGLLIHIFLKTKFISSFQRALLFITVGFLSFFWLLSFWVRPEPHWTAAATIPVIILLYNNTFFHAERKKYVYRFVFPSLLLLFLARLIVIFHFTPVKLEFHGQREWAHQAAAVAGSLPVAFVNSYQKASVYTFYTGKKAFSSNNVYYRRNQFDLWAWDQNFQHQQIATFISPHPRLSLDTTSINIGNELLVIDTLISTQRIVIDFNVPLPTKFQVNQEYNLAVVITNPFPNTVYFNGQSNPVTCSAMFRIHGKWTMVNAEITPYIQSLKGLTSVEAGLKFTVPDISPGRHIFGAGLRTPQLLEGFNSKFYKIEIVR